jgi:hypothetical protein
MRAVMPVAGRVFANARTRGMLCGAGLDIMGNQYASVAKSTTIHAPQLKQWEAAPSSQTTDDPEVKRGRRRAGRTNAGPNVRTFEKGFCGWHSRVEHWRNRHVASFGNIFLTKDFEESSLP